MARTSLYIEADLLKRAKVEAANKGKTLKDLFTEALKEKLSKA